jgi:predicted dehydrogenase
MKSDGQTMSRRRFLGKTSVGAGLVLGVPSVPRAAEERSDVIHVALVGFGRQGQVLFDSLRNIPGLHFQAVCDIADYRCKYGRASVRGFNQTGGYRGEIPNGYVDIDEMLAKEDGLDAAIIATPDFWHAPHTIKCLDAGLHVYCEKMMSNTIDGARGMVRAMDRSKKLCQIGYQRRSNPRYRFTRKHLIYGQRVCGRIVNARAQWHRSVNASQAMQINPKWAPPEDVLRRYGFESLHQYVNWRHYRDLSGGPVADLGSHQIDVFYWLLKARPKTVFASGGNDYFRDREHYDNMMAIFEYETPQGPVRAMSQVLNMTSWGDGFHETFMGEDATIRISELVSRSAIYKESSAHPETWERLVDRGYLKKKPVPAPPKVSDAIQVYESPPPEEFMLPGGLPTIVYHGGYKGPKPVHQPHLENFFAAIRGQVELRCDARRAFESEAPIYWVDASAQKREVITFTPHHLNV